MERWLEEQARMQANDWSTATARFYPDAAAAWRDPDLHMRLLEGHFLPAVREIEWDRFIPREDSRVLDLGAGTGWLSAVISQRRDVLSIDTLDSDEHNLREMLPAMVARLGGDAAKIRPVLGVFEPMPVPDESYDLIVASSSIHHAPNLCRTLREVARVLAPNGHILLLNELPRTHEGFFRYSAHLFGIALDRIAVGDVNEMDEWLSSSGLAYDPRLGDIAYSHYHYESAASRAGLSCETIKTSSRIPPLAGDLRLEHFHLRHNPTVSREVEGHPPPLPEEDLALLRRIREAIPGAIMDPDWSPASSRMVEAEIRTRRSNPRNETVAELQREVDETRAELARAHALLDAMARSRSWRFTRWLRREKAT